MKKLLLLFFAVLGLGIGVGKGQYTVLFNFNGIDGGDESNSLIYASGKLYSTTKGLPGGHIFSIDTNGSAISYLYNGNTSEAVVGSLTLSGNKFYGIAILNDMYGSDVIYSIDTNGNGFKNLYYFDAGGTQGLASGDLTISGKTLYGSCSNGLPPHQFGNIYSIDTDGSNFRILYYFDDSSGLGGCKLAISGNLLYGVTQPYAFNTCGYVFSINTNGSGYTVLLKFNVTNGCSPSNLTVSGNKVYGMTEEGAAYGSGGIFSINTDGSGFKYLQDFNDTNGMEPEGGLTLSGSRLFGMTSWGGQWYGGSHGNGFGCVLSIDTSGKGFRDMYYFDSINGEAPESNVTIVGSTLYGMTYGGGPYAYYGVIFKLDSNSVASLNNLSSISNSINLFPNPSNGIFTIAFVGASASGSDRHNFVPKNIEVFNVLGEQVYSNYQITKSSNYQIDLSSQPSGVYFYRVISEDGGLVGEGKLIINK